MKKTLFLLASMALFALCLTSCEGTSGPTTPSDNGKLPGEFSVSASTKVHFSQGNLQYIGTWQFAEHQWDYFGEAQSDNHRDLFGWGTGNNPNNVSTDYKDYAYIEWGNNAITNGGNKANQWRTLTKDEWVYLFHGRKNAETLFGLGKIDGIFGTILLPDNWTLPKGASFTASTTKGLFWDGYAYVYYENNTSYHGDYNTYTKKQWSVMEKAGAVFLPAAGDRKITRVDLVGWSGGYWSSSPDDFKTHACLLDFIPSMLLPPSFDYRQYGKSVRLVR